MRRLAYTAALCLLTTACSDIHAPPAGSPPMHNVQPAGDTPLIAVGADFTCRTVDGGVACWGYAGTLDDADIIPGEFTALDAGFYNACGLLTSGTVRCWMPGTSTPPVDHTPRAGTVYTHIAVRSSGLCAADSGNRVTCGSQTFDPSPPIRGLAAHSSMACALNSIYRYECLSGTSVTEHSNVFGVSNGVMEGGYDYICSVLFDGTIGCFTFFEDMHQVLPATGSFVDVGTGTLHGCGLRDDGAVQCWGPDNFGKAPALRTTAGGYTSVAAGENHTCATTVHGAVECWGRNDYGQSRSEQVILAGSTLALWPGEGIDASATSGLALTFTSLTPAVCSGSGGRVTVIGNGACEISITQAGNTAWYPASLTLSFAVSGLHAPAALSAVVNGAAVDVSWTDTNAGAGRYRVQRRERTASGWSGWSNVARVAGSSYHDAAVQPGRSYGYRVRACDTERCSVAVGSGVVTLAPLVMAPGSVAGMLQGNDVIDVAWADRSANETRFELQRRLDAGSGWSAWVDIATPAANDVAYRDEALLPGNYQYRVRACTDAACSAWAAGAVVFMPPPVPTGLAGTRISATAADLSWTDTSVTETRFEVRRRAANADGSWAAWGALTRLPRNTTFFTSGPLDPATRYQYGVRACNDGGCSAWAGVRVGTP